jgi:hypothetical protein
MCVKILSPKKSTTGLTPIAWFGIVMAVFGLIISLPISELLWSYLPGFKFVQFPWRFQPFVALGCGLLGATVSEFWPVLNPKSRVRILAVLTWNVVICGIVTIMLAHLDRSNINRAQIYDLLNAPNAKPTTVEESRKNLNGDDLERAAYAANEFYFRPPGSDFNLYPPAFEPGGLSIVSGRAYVVAQKLNIASRKFLISSVESLRARIETYHYPHWVARLDGLEIKIDVEQGSGLMLVDIPAGAHQLRFDYEVRQTSQLIARMISSVAWGALLIWMIMRAVKRLRRKRTLIR